MFGHLPPCLRDLKLATCRSYTLRDIINSIDRLSLESLSMRRNWDDDEEDEDWLALTTRCRDRDISLGLVQENPFW
jgi:hypothetical protein